MFDCFGWAGVGLYDCVSCGLVCWWFVFVRVGVIWLCLCFGVVVGFSDLFVLGFTGLVVYWSFVCVGAVALGVFLCMCVGSLLVVCWVMVLVVSWNLRSCVGRCSTVPVTF